MSLAFHHSAVRVADPRIGAGSDEVRRVIFDGPRTDVYQQVNALDQTTTAQSTFTINVPSVNSGLARGVKLRAAGTFTITGTNLNTANAIQFCLRPWALHSAMSNIEVQVNGASISMGQINALIPAYARCMNPAINGASFQSSSAVAPEVYNRTTDMANKAANSPFLSAGDGPQGDTWQSRTASITSVNIVSATSVVIGWEASEPLIVPPFTPYGSDSEALFGVQQVQVQITWAGFQKALEAAIFASGTATVTSVATAVTTQQLLVNYVTINEKSIAMSRPLRSIISAPSFQLFPTTISTSLAPPAAATPSVFNTVQATSANIQLSVIPRYLIIYATRSQAEVGNNNVACVSNVDSLLPISQVSIQFQNGSSLLAGANAQQLFNISSRNGMVGSEWQFRGLPGFSPAGSTTLGQSVPVGYAAGAPLILDVARDLSLEDGLAPGMSAQTQFQCIATVGNNLGATLTTAAGTTVTQFVLNVLAVTDGVLACENGTAERIIGGISHDDVKKAHAISVAEYSDIEQAVSAHTLSGGSFGSFFKNLVRGATSVASKALPIVQHLAAAAPQSMAQLALASGAGGAMMKRESLRDRLMKRQ